MSDKNTDDAEYGLWEPNHPSLQQVPTPAPGYDSHNGLRKHAYLPSNAVPDPYAARQVTYDQVPIPMAPIQYPGMPQAAYPFVSQTHGGYLHNYVYPQQPTSHQPNFAYGYAAQPAYDSSAAQQFEGPGQVAHQGIMYQTYQPNFTNQPVAAQPMAWLGRTKAEVDEDNMKLAAKENVYEKHKMVPQMPDDKQIWCVELDGSNTLRLFSDIMGNKMVGDWEEDPRFEGAVYFVRKEEKKEEEKE